MSKQETGKEYKHCANEWKMNKIFYTLHKTRISSSISFKICIYLWVVMLCFFSSRRSLTHSLSSLFPCVAAAESCSSLRRRRCCRSSFTSIFAFFFFAFTSAHHKRNYTLEKEELAAATAVADGEVKICKRDALLPFKKPLMYRFRACMSIWRFSSCVVVCEYVVVCGFFSNENANERVSDVERENVCEKCLRMYLMCVMVSSWTKSTHRIRSTRKSVLLFPQNANRFHLQWFRTIHICSFLSFINKKYIVLALFYLKI